MVTSYRKWFFLTIAVALGISIIHLGLVYGCYRSYRGDIIWIDSLLVKKETTANNIKENKLVFVGGSSTLFGIKTQYIQQRLGVSCLNFGIHAGLEIDYLLFRIKDILKPGDTVILTVEYPLFLYEGKFNNVTLDYILSYDRNFFNSLSTWDRIRYLACISPLKLASSLAKRLTFSSKEIEIGEGYNLATLNENGDETCNIGHHEEAINMRFSQPFDIQRGDFQETPGLKVIRDFNRWCRGHHIDFYVTYASTMYFKEYDNAQYRHYFNELQRFFAEHNISTIGTPPDFFFAKDFFYDSQYHLNQKGMAIRTDQLIDMINNLGIVARKRNSLVGEGREKVTGLASPPLCHH
ncbi:MAG: hypothetical protein ACOZFS_05555 [Thermodesulfobacteriota bacterium]